MKKKINLNLNTKKKFCKILTKKNNYYLFTKSNFVFYLKNIIRAVRIVIKSYL